MTRPSVTPLDVDTDEIAPFIAAAIKDRDAIMTTLEALDRRLDRRDRSVISSPYLHAAQRQHFFLFDVVPAALTLAAIALLFVHPLSKTDIVLFLLMWLATGLGLTVGFHRLFSHRAFAAGPAVSVALLILGSMAGRGPMISWVAMLGATTNTPIAKAICILPTCMARRLCSACAGGCTRIGRG
jgi:hypothetical protein